MRNEDNLLLGDATEDSFKKQFKVHVHLKGNSNQISLSEMSVPGLNYLLKSSYPKY